MIVVVVESDLPVGHDLAVLSQSLKFRVPIISDMFDLVGMHSDAGIHKRVDIGQSHCRLAGGQIATDSHHGVDPGFSGSGDHGITVLVKACIVEVGMGVDQHW